MPSSLHSKPGYTKCVWCGAQPTTKEDVLPVWTRKVFGVEERTTSQRRGRLAGKLYELRERPVRDAAVMQVKAVCQPCNNGWMSQMEQRTEALLTHLIYGRARRITAEDQRLLAVWAAKTAAMLECFYGRAPEQRFLVPIMDGLQPSLVTTVSIAYLHEFELVLSAATVGFEPHGRPAARTHGSIDVLGLGHLAFVVIFSPVSQRGVPMPLTDPQATHHIWPAVPHPFRWPPRFRIDQHSLFRIAQLQFPDVDFPDLNDAPSP